MTIIKISPVTRISGFLSSETEIEDHYIVNAMTSGMLFRGFELMLSGRSPFDAVYYTERICGICSTAHSLAATLALESAMGIIPPEQGRYLRDIIHGCEFLQNHIRHFYQYTIPDYVRLPEEYPVFEVCHSDFRLPEDLNALIQKHYFESMEFSRSAHEMIAIFGGKAPHNHGIFIGGASVIANSDKILRMKAILYRIKQFITDKMIPDVYTIARYYSDYFHNGGGYGNLISYGCFDHYDELGTLYVNPLVYSGGSIEPFHHGKIIEEIEYSWYRDGLKSYTPFETIPVDEMNKTKAYSFVKAVKYNDLFFEGGPLARMWLSGLYRNGISTMDRTIARVLEANKIAEVIGILLDHLIPLVDTQKQYEVPAEGMGLGLVDTTRGPLGHWNKINDSRISFYQVITPSVWNVSSRGNDGRLGTMEMALVGTYIKDEENPVELGRIMRSFDPCVSCATHVYCKGKEPRLVTIIP